MNKTLLKNWLLQKKHGVYSLIVDTYKEQVTSLKPGFFIEWIGHELGVRIEDISAQALYGAIKRSRKKDVQKPIPKLASIPPIPLAEKYNLKDEGQTLSSKKKPGEF